MSALLDRMLCEAKRLDTQTRKYEPCCLIEQADAGKWRVRGCNRLFDSDTQAAEFCQELAAGRPVGIIICDIPRTPIIEEGADDFAATDENSNRCAQDVTAHFQYGSFRGT